MSASPRDHPRGALQRIHGLRIASSLELPGIPRVDGDDPDVLLYFVDALPRVAAGALELYRSELALEEAQAVISSHGDTTCFRYSDGTAFDVVPGRRSAPDKIAAVIAPGQTLEDCLAYLFGPVLGYLLRARGVLALHASAVLVNDGVALFAGEHGAGKSTLAAAFAQQGARVLSDDLVALERDGARFVAHHAFDHVRLWPASAPLLGLGDTLPRITPTWEKRRFALDAQSFATKASPVRAVYLLTRDDAAHANVERMHERDALLALATVTYANYLLDAPMRAHELLQLAQLANVVPVRRLLRGADVGVAPLRDAVLSDLGIDAKHGVATH